MSLITLTTDFGVGSPYVAAMKGAILSINPAATLVDITHTVCPQDIRHGALILADVTDRFPAGTIHVAVVDPGVGTDRAIVCACLGRQTYVAPDNGLLSLVARRAAPGLLIRLADPAYWLQPVSATFHGRDIMAPAAGWLSLGLDPRRLGPPVERLADLEWPEPRATEGRVEGEVLAVDSFGNLITNVPGDMLTAACADDRTAVTCGAGRASGIVRTYADRLKGELIALVGSTGRLELAIVGGSAAEVLRVGPGHPVTITWGRGNRVLTPWPQGGC